MPEYVPDPVLGSEHPRRASCSLCGSQCSFDELSLPLKSLESLCLVSSEPHKQEAPGELRGG